MLLSHLMARWFFLFLALSFSAQAMEIVGANTRAASIAFLKTLNEKQLEAVILPSDHENRWSMRFTGGGDRPGLLMSSLRPEQKKAVDTLISLVLSKKGLAKVKEIQKQDGDFTLHRLVIAFFGDPRKEKSFVWRIGEHHFTVVNVEMENLKIVEFGPILLGSNPYGPWDSEEKNFIDLYAKCQDAVTVIKGSGISSRPLRAGHGTSYTALSRDAQAAVKKAWNHRMDLFTPGVRSSLQNSLAEAGGWDSLSLAFYKEAPNRLGKDGGRWDAKLGNDKVLFDIELSRGHNHMSIWMRTK